MNENLDTDSLLSDALASAKTEVVVDSRQATPSSELGSPVNALGDDVPAFLSEASASAELNIYPDGYQPLIVDGVALPRCASERVRGMSASDREAWEKMRFRARTEPLFLANQLMGMSLQENPHEAFFLRLPKMVPGTPFTQLAEAGRKFMLLWSRSLGKTSCIRVFIMMVLLNYPNIRIGFLTGSKDLGKDQLKPLKAYFENPSPLFKTLFPEYCLKSVKDRKTGEWEDRILELGTTVAFSVPCRNTHFSVGNSFALLSSDMRFSGMHCDLLMTDDLVNNSNSGTAAALANTFQEYLQVTPLLTAKGILIMTGTRYHQDDAYARIMERYIELERGDTRMWTFDIRGCYSRGPCKNCGHYEIFHDVDRNPVEAPCMHSDCHCQKFIPDGGNYVLFPEVINPDGEAFGYTLAGLEAMRAEDEKFFNLQMLNEPLASSHNVFARSLIEGCTILTKKDIPPSDNRFTFICGDLAYSEGDLADRDNSVLYVFQVALGRIWVWHCVAGKMSENAKLDAILGLIRDVRPRAVFFEKAMGWKTLNERLLENGPRYGLDFINIIWTDVSNAKGAKALRIEQVEVAMKRDRIRLLATMDGYETLVKELLAFPSSRHDDFSDALSQCVAADTGVMTQKIPTPRTALDDIRAHIGMDRPNVEELYPDSGGGSGVNCGGGNENWK